LRGGIRVVIAARADVVFVVIDERGERHARKYRLSTSVLDCDAFVSSSAKGLTTARKALIEAQILAARAKSGGRRRRLP